MQLTFAGKEKPIPSMALELAARAQQAEPVIGEDGSVTLAGYRIPSAVQNTMTLNFDGGANDIQTYSLADLRACVERDDKDFFRREFAGKVVIFGTLLDAEDRKFTSKRFATGFGPGERAALRACRRRRRAPPSSAAAPLPASISMRRPSTTCSPATRWSSSAALPTLLIAIGFALLAAVAARWLAPAWAASATFGMACVWTVAATLPFAKALVLPLSEPFAAGLAG